MRRAPASAKESVLARRGGFLREGLLERALEAGFPRRLCAGGLTTAPAWTVQSALRRQSDNLVCSLDLIVSPAVHCSEAATKALADQ